MAYYSVIFVPKITGIGQLLLKLLFVVGCYPFLRHSVGLYTHTNDVVSATVVQHLDRNVLYAGAAMSAAAAPHQRQVKLKRLSCCIS